MAGLLVKKGHQLTTDLSKAGSVIIHTCSFIKDARDESAETIKKISELKQRGVINNIIVTGCMVQQEKEAMFAMFPEADSFIGTGELDKISSAVARPRGLLADRPAGGLIKPERQRLLSSSLPSAYIRVSEGCNHRCSFCIIPKLRGRHTSRPLPELLREAKELVLKGIKEISLIGQDTSVYGSDLYGKPALSSLIAGLDSIHALKWLRILYAYPSSVTKDLIESYRGYEKLCRYIDIPLQHVNKSVLAAMRRSGDTRKTVERLINGVPGIAVRTTFIVGFPGETEAQFMELYNFAAHGYFDHMGVFEYSGQEGLASESLGPKVPENIKAERRKALMLLQQDIVKKKNKARKGAVLEVLVERMISKDTYFGRAAHQAPEIDSGVLIAGRPKIGSFVKVKIDGDKGYDLTGKLIK